MISAIFYAESTNSRVKLLRTRVSSSDSTGSSVSGSSRTSGSHFSGDLFLALSTGNPGAFSRGSDTLFAKGSYDELRFARGGT